MIEQRRLFGVRSVGPRSSQLTVDVIAVEATGPQGLAPPRQWRSEAEVRKFAPADVAAPDVVFALGLALRRIVLLVLIIRPINGRCRFRIAYHADCPSRVVLRCCAGPRVRGVAKHNGGPFGLLWQSPDHAPRPAVGDGMVPVDSDWCSRPRSPCTISDGLAWRLAHLVRRRLTPGIGGLRVSGIAAFRTFS
jgi:hypothetical protein